MVKRVVMLVVGSLSMMACGPGAKIDGKQGAAEALFAASGPTKAKAETSASPINLTGGINWNCPEGGSAGISGAGINVGTGGVSTSVKITYKGCGLARSSVGTAVFNGDMTLSQDVIAGGATVSVDQSFKGRVLVQGAYDDFLDADIRQQIAVGDLGAAGSGVSMTLKGTISTSEGTFTFDNEIVTVAGGSISVKVQASK